MKSIIKSPIVLKLDIKYKLSVNKVDLYNGDIRVDIKFNSLLLYNLAKEHFNRTAIIRLFTGLKTPDNHVFVRKFGYFDLSNTITIIIYGSNVLLLTFLTLVLLIAKLAIKALLSTKPLKLLECKLRVADLNKPYIAKLNKTNTKGNIMLSYNSTTILQYPKSKTLFDKTINQLRKLFKKLNDDELWAFGMLMSLFFKGFK